MWNDLMRLRKALGRVTCRQRLVLESAVSAIYQKHQNDLNDEMS